MSDEPREPPANTGAADAAPKTDDYATAFVNAVRALHLRGETGKLAALRRAAGEPFGGENARNVLWFYDLLARFVPEGVSEQERPRREQTFFLVATLLAYDRAALEGRTSSTPSNFGHTVARMRAAGESAAESGVGRRFRILLDAAREPDGTGELPFRLRQMVRLAISKGAPIHWPTLLNDLLRWEHPSRRTQKEWARDFFAPAAPLTQTEATAQTAGAAPNTGD